MLLLFKFHLGVVLGGTPFLILWLAAERAVDFWRSSYIRLWDEIDNRMINIDCYTIDSSKDKDKDNE